MSLQSEKKHFFPLLLPGTAMVLMLLLPELTLRGTRRGMLLWYQFFLPAVFPFMILSGLMTRYLKKGGPFFAVVGGFLNGYPNGAKIAADLNKKRLLSDRTAPYYAVFCNMSGPMFLASYADLKREMPVIYLVSTLLLCVFCRLSAKKEDHQVALSASDSSHTDLSSTGDFLLECTGIMVKAGIYIMYFSILVELLAAVSFTIPQLQYLIPFLEMTTGIACIQDASFPSPGLRLYYRLFLCVTGGGCTVFQTQEVIRGMKLPIWKYIGLKIIQGTVICGVCFSLNMLFS